MKRGVIIFLVLCLSVTLFMLQHYMRKKPIQVGFVASLSGRLSQMGVSARNGVELAVENMNKRGGILGRKIQFIPKDNKGDPNTTYKVIRELIDEGVKIIIGPLTSNMADPTIKAIQGKDVLVVSPTISTDAVKDLDDNFLRVAPVSSEQAKSIAKEILNEGYNVAAVVYDSSNKAYTEPVYQLFKELFEREGRKITYVNSLADKERLSFLQIAEEIKESQAETLILITSGIDAASLCQQIRKIDLAIKIYGSSWVKTNDLIEHGGKSVEGVSLVSAFEGAEKTEDYLTFQEQYKSVYKGDPTFVSVQSYDAIQVVFSGIKTSNSANPKLIKEAILKTKTFKGLEETFMINEFGDAIRKLSVFVVKEGRFVRIDE